MKSRFSRRSSAITCVAASLMFFALPAAAQTLKSFLAASKVDGEARAFFFSRDYQASSVPNADAFALAGLFGVHTADFLGGFSVAGRFFTAHSLGTQSSDPRRVDVTLIGPGDSINALGEAYLQYHAHGVLLRAGDQLVNTPWINASDARVLPATYQGIFGQWTPLAGVKLTAMRLFRYKSRTSGDYFRDNNYYKPTYAGDRSYGGINNLPLSAPAATGALAFGAGYSQKALKAALWYYDDYAFAHMLYGQIDDAVDLGLAVKPFVGVQGVREWGSNTVFAQTATTFFARPGNATNNTTYGAVLGVEGYGSTLSFAYNRIDPQGSGALGGGVLVSPYTASYVTDPLYTSSMIRGLVELGPGVAWKVKATTSAMHKKIQLILSFARYRTDFSGNDNETYLDVTYAPGGRYRGLSLRDRLEVGNGNVNPGKRLFIYNRVQLVYAF